MNKLKLIFLCLVLSTFVCGQEIGNYVTNGSFEDRYDCVIPHKLYKIKGWMAIDSTGYGGANYSYCNFYVPSNFYTYQLPRTGETYILTTFFWYYNGSRGYLKNRLKQTLQSGKTYCVKFHVNITNTSTFGMDGFGAYFGDNTIDTITHTTVPLTFLNPQVQNPTNNIIKDTLKWVVITGTFTANGNEKYMLIGNFKSDNVINTDSLNPTNLPLVYTDVCTDDVSCIEVNLLAYSGPDKSCVPGDSVFIGRQPDFAIDTGCVWYKLPNMTTAIDTISGLWVKPTTTSTYVVRQQLDCSSLKWDTVVVFMNPDGSRELQWYSNNINLFPNPTTDKLTISFSSSSPVDIYKISIINAIGQSIREEEIEIKNNSFILQTSDLDKGIYQVLFKTKAGILTKQFVKN